MNNELLDEQEVLDEFEQELLKAYNEYQGIKNITYPALDIFIGDKVWESKIKYHRMMMTTKQKFFEDLKKGVSVEEYSKQIKELWENIDHEYMYKAIEEARLMTLQKDFKGLEMYSSKKITERSIKLQNARRDYIRGDYEFYTLTPESDFRALERRYVNRHIKYYSTTLKRVEKALDSSTMLEKLVEQYDKIDKNIPYRYKDGTIKCWNTIDTYNSMLYNVNLLRASWNRSLYDSKLLDNHLWYLPAHTFACPVCAEYQGYVYADEFATPEEISIAMRIGKPGFYKKEYAILDGVGHPNCKHNWVLYWSEEQIQDEKWNSPEWEEKYKAKQKIQSIDLQKSRLLTDRRIYKELGNQDLVDKMTTKIKALREKKKELEAQL